MSIFEKFYLVKLCPIFDSSASLAPQRYQKILLGCLLGYKTVMNFICTSVKFNNRHHTTARTTGRLEEIEYLVLHTILGVGFI